MQDERSVSAMPTANQHPDGINPFAVSLISTGCMSGGIIMKYPVPSHLRPYFKVVGEENDEFKVNGTIHCTCGHEQFEIWENNDRRIIKLVCKHCGKELLLFDSDKHGWDGFVCHDNYNDRSLPFQKYVCPQCEKDRFLIKICILSQGKQDFIKECVSYDDSFSEDGWVDGFEWITIGITCAACLYDEKGWLDLETM